MFFGGTEEKGFLLSGSWGALFIILAELWKLAHSFGDLGSPAKN